MVRAQLPRQVRVVRGGRHQFLRWWSSQDVVTSARGQVKTEGVVVLPDVRFKLSSSRLGLVRSCSAKAEGLVEFLRLVEPSTT